MPAYRVDEPRFWEGTLYAPGTRHSVITTKKVLKPVPAGLTQINESAADRKAREAEVAAAAAAKKQDMEDLGAPDFRTGTGGTETLA